MPLIRERQFVSRRANESGTAYKVRKTFNYTLLTQRKTEYKLLILDLVLIVHGITGLVYVYRFDRCDYRQVCAELFYLLVVYMWAATLGFTFKVLRYIWLFRYLFKKLESQELHFNQANSVAHDLPVFVYSHSRGFTS